MERFELRQELQKAIFNSGITGLLSSEKLARNVKEPNLPLIEAYGRDGVYSFLKDFGGGRF